MQKKNLFGILILIAYFASCNQIHKTHYENGWYHILSQQKDSIAKESIVTVKDFVSLRMDSDENGTCVIVGQISKHKPQIRSPGYPPQREPRCRGHPVE